MAAFNNTVEDIDGLLDAGCEVNYNSCRRGRHGFATVVCCATRLTVNPIITWEGETNFILSDRKQL